MYQDTARLDFSAKSIASVVFPVPARPQIIVELQERRLCCSWANKRGLGMDQTGGGILIFSEIGAHWSWGISAGGSDFGIATRRGKFEYRKSSTAPRMRAVDGGLPSISSSATLN